MKKRASLCEAEQRLDANLFLDELPQWGPGRLHHLYLYERMFAHAKAAGQREHNCGICWHCQQPSRGRNLQVEVPALELCTQETTWEEAIALYHKVYQLKRSPGEVPCSADVTEEIHIEILETLRECLWHRWGCAQLERETR